MVVPLAPALVPMPKKDRVMQLKMDDGAASVAIALVIGLVVMCITVGLFWMLSANVHNHSLKQRNHDNACKTISDEKLRRDCLSGVHTLYHDGPAYAK